ncbi:MAG: secretin N-terminal domain-containing protein [Planctomycetota bacterium]
MVAKRHKGRGPAEICVLIFLVIAFLAGGYLHASNGAGGSGLGRYRVFSLKFIPAKTGKEYLAKAGIGTVSQLPGANTLLVTASQEELLKATAILRLVDSDAQFVLETIQTAWDVNNLPLEQIRAKLAVIEIGTFISPPLRSSKPRAVIDIHDGRVMVVAPVERFEEIISVIEQEQQTISGVAEGLKPEEYIEPNQTRGPALEARAMAELEMAEAELEKMAVDEELEELESDELFSRLLGSLAEAEKSAAEKAPEATMRDQVQPETVAPAPQPPGQERLIRQKVRRPSEVAEVAAEKARRIQQAEPRPEEAEAVPGKPQEVVQERVKAWSYEPQIDLKGDEMLDLDLPERLEINDLLGLVGEYLGLDYMYDPEKVKGSVALRLRGPIKVRDLYPLLESVLKFQGFVMTRKGNLVTIVPAAEAMSIDPALQIEDGKVELGNVVITRVFELEYLDTASATNLLKGMQLGADITPIPETGNLIVTDYAYRMERIEEVLGIVDKPGRPKQFRFRQLKYTMASTLAPKIKSLAEQLGTVSITISAATPARPQPARTTRRTTPAARPAQRPTPTPAAAAKPTVYLDADERTNRILMIGLEDQLVIVDDLISALDVEQQDLRALRLYDIQYVGAEEVRDKLIELGIIGATTRRGQSPYLSRDRRSTAAQARTPAAAQQAARTPTTTPGATGTTSDREPLTEEPQVVIVESTNSLLVNATAEQHAQIAMIIGYVDTETIETAIPYEIYSLENQKPEDLAAVLEKLIQETIEDKEGKIERTIKKIDEEIIVVPDENTFSLIVYANRKNQEWIGKLIESLDKRRPQVLLDATLVEITQSDTFNYDLQMVTKYPKLPADGAMELLEAIVEPFPDSRVIEGTSRGGTVKGFYADEDIQLLLTLMQKKDYGRVLSKPKILVNDNEMGNISTMVTTYVARSSSVVPTGDNQFISEATTFDEFSSGITLEITPHISEGDLLRLEISLVRSDQESASGSAADSPPPDKTENMITTIVTVPDNSTIILGGILQLNQDKDGSKVPILGDIPLVGGLFRTIDNSDLQTKLYIFVKANILRPDETEGLPDLERISERNRLAFERHEQKFQEYEQWPGIKPEPMDPLRVLEAE